MKENSINNWEEMTLKHTNNRIQKKPNDFRLKYGNQKHIEKAEWINNMIRELKGLEESPKAEILIDLIKTTLKKISNWKTPGHDGIHGFWFKKFTSIHDRLALAMNKCLQRAPVPEWMTKERTIMSQKDPNKGTATNNYRLITCLPMMWKILSAQKREDIYYLLTSHGLFPDELRGCCKVPEAQQSYFT